MHHSRLLSLLAGAALLGAAVNSWASPPPQVNGKDLLTSASGRTLYTYAYDSKGHSTCTAACAKVWPPYFASTGATARRGLAPIRRDDGRMQWAWHGHALYLYRDDLAAGDSNGEGINGVWHVVHVHGASGH